MKTDKKQPKGFTLVELMIVLVILGIISIGAMTAITGQSKVYNSEEDLVDMQMNAKIAMDRICFLLRMAGVGSSDSFGNNLTSGNLATNGDVAANPLKEMFVITNPTFPASDQLTLVGAVKYAAFITNATTTQITLNTSDHDIKSNSTDAAKSYIFISPSDNNRYKIISTVAGTALTPASNLDVEEVKEINDALALTPPIDLDVYQVQAFTIRLVDTTINGKNLRSLRIDNNVDSSNADLDIADNIQNLQFEYGLDTTNDGQIDSWNDNPANIDITQIRAIRVFILARTGKIDREYTDTKTYTLAGSSVGPFTGTNPNDLNTHKNVHRYLLENTITVRNRNF